LSYVAPSQLEHSEAVIAAARWLSEQDPSPRPIVPVLRERFGVSAKLACEIIALAGEYRMRRISR
jgi:hypothetical protein